MKRLLICSILALGMLTTASAQKGTKTLTIKDAINGYHLYPKRLSQLQWLPSGKAFSQVVDADSSKALSVTPVEKTNNAKSLLISLETLNEACKKVDKEFDLKRFPRVKWLNDNEFKFSQKKKEVTYSLESKSVTIADKPSYTSSARSKNGKYVASLSDSGIDVYSEEGKMVTRVSDQSEGIVIGQAVHRYEFGITQGLFWAPTEDKLAYYWMDESMVTSYPLYQLNDTPATPKSIRYPTAGKASHHVKVMVVDVNKGTPIELKVEGPKEQYFTNISWHPNGEIIYVAVVNRKQNHCWLNAYNANDGSFIKTLFEESNDRYVEPEHAMEFINDNEFIWWSERDGYNHLYLYNIDGSLINQITKGKWVVTSLVGVDKEKRKAFIMGTKDSPIERHLYCVDLKSGKTKKLTQEAGTHRVRASEGLTHFIDEYSSTTTPRQTNIITAEGSNVAVLAKAENPLTDYKLGAMELGKLKAKDGSDLHYRVFKPTDFDATKKYPVVVYLYNGPHVQLVNNTWLGGANLWYQYMAQKGYVVFTLDGHGSANRGFEFESAVHRNMADLEMEDQMIGVDWLKKQSYVDANRMGIHGWSYGGFMTISMMTRQNVFKVGVAGGPVIDWKFYEIMYTERYMDSPQENPEGFKKANLINYIDSLNGKLLVIHGAQDDVVLWQHSLLYLQEAIKKGKQLDYFVYPQHPHNVRGTDRSHLYEKVSQYFFDHL